MNLTFLKGVALGSVVAMATLTATSAMAGTGIGGVFNLGKTNKVNATTSLTGTASGPMLTVTNNGSGSGLSLRVGAGKPPFTVNSKTQVANLNASLLGGLASASFVQGGGDAHAYALTLTGNQSNVLLLSVPGFGSFRANCSTGLGGQSFITYANGPKVVDVWENESDRTPLAYHEDPFPAFTTLPVGGALNDSTTWTELMIHYTTRSGVFFLQHVATVNVASSVAVGSGHTLCGFIAEERTGSARFQP